MCFMGFPSGYEVHAFVLLLLHLVNMQSVAGNRNCTNRGIQNQSGDLFHMFLAQTEALTCLPRMTNFGEWKVSWTGEIAYQSWVDFWRSWRDSSPGWRATRETSAQRPSPLTHHWFHWVMSKTVEDWRFELFGICWNFWKFMDSVWKCTPRFTL